MSDSRPDDSFRFGRIGGADDGHIRQTAHDGHVFNGLMGRPVFADAEAGVGRTDLDVELWQADGVANLFKGPTRAEDGKSAGQGNLAAGGEARRRAHHILFRNAHIEIAFRRYLFKSNRPRRRTQVGVEDDNPRIFIQFRF